MLVWYGRPESLSSISAFMTNGLGSGSPKYGPNVYSVIIVLILQLHQFHAAGGAALDAHLGLAQPEVLGDQRNQRGICLAVDRRRLHARQPPAVVELDEAFLARTRSHLELQRAHARRIMR